jgi:hypothetical protein
MNEAVLDKPRMAGRKKENFERERVEFKASPEWIERAVRAGEHIGLNLSAFIRMVVSQYLDRMEAEQSVPRRRSTSQS